jgi:hypothetical protein
LSIKVAVACHSVRVSDLGRLDVMDSEISAALAAAARSINTSQTLPDTLQAIVEAARISLPGFDHVGISTTRNGEITTRAATDQLVWTLDKLQYSLNEGPCLDAVREERAVSAPRIRHDQRWPRYVPKAVKEHGLVAQLGVRLYLDDEGTVGGLNIYSTDREDVDDVILSTAELFATHAAVAFGKACEVHNLSEGLVTRKVIGQAIGLIMAKYDTTEDAAFAFLRRASSHANTKLRDIAEDMVRQANEKATHRK